MGVWLCVSVHLIPVIYRGSRLGWNKYRKQSPQIIRLQQGMDFLLLMAPVCMGVFAHVFCASLALASQYAAFRITFAFTADN